MTATETLAVGLYIAGAVFALLGPAIAAVRTVAKYREATTSEGGYDMIDALGTPAYFVPKARAEAWWSVVEFALVGIGVALSAVASIILIA